MVCAPASVRKVNEVDSATSELASADCVSGLGRLLLGADADWCRLVIEQV
jgi:hypothetical protein